MHVCSTLVDNTKKFSHVILLNKISINPDVFPWQRKDKINTMLQETESSCNVWDGLDVVILQYISQVLLVARTHLPIQETRDTDSFPGSGSSAEEGMATHSSIVAWRLPWTEEPAGLESIGLHRVGHNWSDLALTHTYCNRERGNCKISGEK